MAKKKEVKEQVFHVCAGCKKKFQGTGQRGRPFKNCPDCRKK